MSRVRYAVPELGLHLAGRAAAVLTLLTVLSGSVVAQESKPALEPAFKEYRDASGKVAIQLPAAWRVLVDRRRREQERLTLWIRLPGEKNGKDNGKKNGKDNGEKNGKGNDKKENDKEDDKKNELSISVMEVPGAASPLAQAFRDLSSQMKLAQAQESKVVAEPVPHVISDSKKDPIHQDRVTILAYRRFPCRGIHTYLWVHRDLLARVRDPFFAAVQSITCSLPRWPELPEGYSQVEKDGILYCVRRGVPAAAVKRVQKCAASVREEFVRLHGAYRPAELPMVVIHRYEDEHAALDEQAPKDQFLGAHVHVEGRRVMVAVYGEGAAEREAALAWHLAYLFFTQRYGDDEPRWACVGEAHIARMRALTGRKLPYVTKTYKDLLVGVSQRLADLELLRPTEFAKYCDHAEVYVKFFHAGPGAYRKAYKAMLEDCRQSGDSEGAPRRHLFALDQDKLLADVGRFVARKLKVPRGR